MSGKKDRKKRLLEDGRNVFPGEQLAIIEEFMDGDGTYIEEGHVRSEELGKVHHDWERREVEVDKKTPSPILPAEGMTAIAEAGSVARRDARVDIFMLDEKHVYPTISGVIHISDVSKDYVKNMDLAVRSGDVLKAKVINTKNNLNQLSMEGTDFGVIYAHCSRCGEIMERHQGRLKCPTCGRVERRKVAKSYGEEDIS